MSISEEPTIYCYRCNQPGGVAFRGWQILCQQCIDKELGEYLD